jgi:hypothetical protein
MKDYKKAYKELEKDYKKLVKLCDKYENEHNTVFRYWLKSILDLTRENRQLKEVIHNQEEELLEHIKRELLSKEEEIELL